MAGKFPAIAERFANLLEATGLTRQQLTDGLAGAVTPRSLYAILAGDRRPSRALAVLIERTYGYRAEYLLHGRHPVWASPADHAIRDLSDDERDLIAFARRSADNARLVRAELDRALLWESLYDRTRHHLAELDALRQSDDKDDQRLYPAAVGAVLADATDVAERFGTLTRQLYDRRVADLVRRYLRVFLPRRTSGAKRALAAAEARFAEVDAAVERTRHLLSDMAQRESPLLGVRAGAPSLDDVARDIARSLDHAAAAAI